MQVSDDDSLGPDHFYNTWGQTINDISVKWGKTFDTWKESKALLEKVGFVDVVEKRYKWPMNGWSSDPALKRLGELNRIRVTEHIQGFTLRLLTGPGKVSVHERVPREHSELTDLTDAITACSCFLGRDEKRIERH